MYVGRKEKGRIGERERIRIRRHMGKERKKDSKKERKREKSAIEVKKMKS